MPGAALSHFVVGVVSQLHDKKPGQVKVKFPHLGMCESTWCAVAMPMGGPGRGTVFLPEPGDHVVVAFEHGDVNHAYVLGAIWSDSQAPPQLDGKAAQNNLRLIRSRSGHQIRLDDTPGGEKIEIVDKDGARKLVIDTAGKKIQVVCDSGNVEVTVASGDVTVKAAGGAITLEGKTVSVKSSGDLNIQATGALNLKGSTVNIN
jgi:phage baseplate assembly protein V